MKLSKRLKKIADMIPTGSHVLDIGCDHALLDIYLTLEKSCSCVASDINENALSIAKANIEKYHLTDRIETVCAPGLSGVSIDLEDYVVISGMGAITMLDILTDSCCQNIDHIILQSNRDLDLLRRGMVERGFDIKDEVALLDAGIYYVILCCEKGKQIYTDSEYRYGPILLQQDPVYLQYLLEKEKKMLDRLPSSYIEKRKQISSHMKCLEEAIQNINETKKS